MDAQAPSTPPSDPIPAPGKKLLIVEDDFNVRDIYKIEARDKGYDVHEAADGAEAMQQTKLLVPDFILLDIMLPKVNGIDVLKTIRSWEGFKSIPIIIISNVTDTDTYKEAIESGATDYIVKFNSTPQQIIESLQKYNQPNNLPQSPAP